MYRLISQVAAGVLSLWLATKFVSGVEFIGSFKYLLIAGAVLGLINFFLKPILKLVSLPLRILTFGLFTLVINMALVWIVDVLFEELIIQGLIPLFWTTVIIWLVSLLLGAYSPKRKTLPAEKV